MKIDWITVIVYIIVLFVIWYVVKAESHDIQCQDMDGMNCGPLSGRAYSYGAPLDGDNKEELLKKIRLTSHYETNSIHWRRSFIVAAIAAFITGYLSHNRIPNAREFIISFLVIYILVYLSYVMFQKWVTYRALSQLEEIIEALEKL